MAVTTPQLPQVLAALAAARCLAASAGSAPLIAALPISAAMITAMPEAISNGSFGVASLFLLPAQSPPFHLQSACQSANSAARHGVESDPLKISTPRSGEKRR